MTSPCVLNHSGIITARSNSWTEMPLCFASVSNSVKVCGPKATITLTDVLASFPGILLSLEGEKVTRRDTLDTKQYNAGQVI